VEIIHQIIAESVSGGVFNFIGYWLMITIFIGVPAKLIGFIINRILRHWTIRKHGYPPPHCDADGDFKEKDN